MMMMDYRRFRGARLLLGIGGSRNCCCCGGVLPGRAAVIARRGRPAVRRARGRSGPAHHTQTHTQRPTRRPPQIYLVTAMDRPSNRFAKPLGAGRADRTAVRLSVDGARGRPSRPVPSGVGGPSVLRCRGNRSRVPASFVRPRLH